MWLSSLLSDLKKSSGLQSKTHIQPIAKALQQAYPNPLHNGDDAAALPDKHNGGYQLICGEGFLQNFTEHDPWFAGWCSVMVNVSDIAAMGGRPTAMTNTYWGKNDEHCEKLFAGMAAASRTFQVPIVGGHTNLQSEQPHLAVSMTGYAKKLLSSFSAKPDQDILMAVDLRGQYQPPFLNWNAATHAPAKQLQNDYALLPWIAEAELASAAKDISQAGTLGTLVMLLESADLGAEINLSGIPKPDSIPFEKWLKTFPSFGFILTCDPENTDQLSRVFHKRNIVCKRIGKTNTNQQLWVQHEKERQLFWDVKNTALTGFNAQQTTSLSQSLSASKHKQEFKPVSGKFSEHINQSQKEPIHA